MRVVVFTRSEEFAESLRRFFRSVHESDIEIRDWGFAAAQRQGATGSAFEDVAVLVRDLAHDTRSTTDSGWIAVLDPPNEAAHQLKNLNPIDPAAESWGLLAATLVLAFPKLYVLLVGPCGFAGSSLARLAHGLSARTLRLTRHMAVSGLSSLTLLDGTGLREQIRALMRETREPDGSVPMRSLLCRNKFAVSIDEESSYAVLEAYVAFRMGFRACPVTTWRVVSEVLGVRTNLFPRAQPQPSGLPWPTPDLVFEDLYLNFLDMPAGLPEAPQISPAERRLSNLRYRDHVFERLGDAKQKNGFRRVIVTVGHRRSPALLAKWRVNLAYVKSAGGRLRIIYKPVAGMFSFLHAAGLSNRHLRKRGRNASNGDEGTHSAPGRLVFVAEVLIGRASQLLATAKTAVEAVHAAVLACEAKELLVGKTPTTALEAVALQHEAEVAAESMFLGVEYNIDVKQRFKDIQREVEDVSVWFAARQRHRSSLNARLTIAERLAHRFSGLHQVEEELACLAHARKLRFDLWVREKPWRWVLWPVLRYVAFTLASLGRFVAGVVSWILFFAVIHYFLHSLPDASSAARFWHALASSAYFFATLQPCEAMSHSALMDGVLAAQGFVAFLNLGLLISHLYLTASRR